MDRYLPVGIGVIGFLGGMAAKSFEIADLVATKPYVEERMKTVRTYVDDVTNRNLQSAYEHSDMNRQTMLIKLEQYQSDVKSMSVKTDMILDMVREGNRPTNIKR